MTKEASILGRVKKCENIGPVESIDEGPFEGAVHLFGKCEFEKGVGDLHIVLMNIKDEHKIVYFSVKES